MSCACENRRLAQERDRVCRLAKGLAVMEGKDAVVYRSPDGSFGFCVAGEERDNKVIEYLTPY